MKSFKFSKACICVLSIFFVLICSSCDNKIIPNKDLVLVPACNEFSSFYIQKYELTQDVYKKVMNENPSANVGAKFPVESISFYDVIYFCNKLSEMDGFKPCYSLNGSTNVDDWNYIPHTGASIVNYQNIECDYLANGYRIPTMKEWVYAANGGSKESKYTFAGSNDVGEVAWYSGNTVTSRKVGQKKPNELGIYDMSGNVWEWCWDSFGKNADQHYYIGGSYKDISSNSSIFKVIRFYNAHATYDALGVRLMRNVE